MLIFAAQKYKKLREIQKENESFSFYFQERVFSSTPLMPIRRKQNAKKPLIMCL